MSYLVKTKHSPEHSCILPSPLSAGIGSYWRCEDRGLFRVKPGCGKVWRITEGIHGSRAWEEAQWPPPPPGAPSGLSSAQKRGQDIREGRR